MIDNHADVMLNTTARDRQIIKDIFQDMSFPRGKNVFKTEKNRKMRGWLLMVPNRSLLRKKTNFSPADQTGAVLRNSVWDRKN